MGSVTIISLYIQAICKWDSWKESWTIKRMAARSNSKPFRHGVLVQRNPAWRYQRKTVPAKHLHTCHWNTILDARSVDEVNLSTDVLVGRKVFVKPAVSRCTTVWLLGTITSVNSDQNIEVDGIPRHVSDIRTIPDELNHDDENGDGGIDIYEHRNRKPPDWYGNNIYDTWTSVQVDM